MNLKPASRGLFVVKDSTMTIYEAVMAAGTKDRDDFTTKDYLDARDALIRGEITRVGDQVTAAVGDLRTDMDGRLLAIDSELKLRPTVSNLHRSVATGAGAIVVAIVGFLAALWAALDTGATMTASFSDRVLASQDQYENVSEQLNAVDAKYKQIDAKLDKIIVSSGGATGDYSNTATTANRH